MITFNRGDSIELLAAYAPHPTLPVGHNTRIGRFVISNIPAPSATDTSAKVRVKVKLDINGVFTLETAQLVEALEAVPASDAQPMEVRCFCASCQPC